MIDQINKYQQAQDKILGESLDLKRIHLDQSKMKKSQSKLIPILQLIFFSGWWILIAINDYLFWEEALVCTAIFLSLLLFRAFEQNNPLTSKN